MNDHRVIGILGGMGPEATADLFLKVIKATKVQKDQDHFRVVIDSNPKIPDRTNAILHRGESPIAAMVETGRNLEKMGVDIVLIPCNTAHYFIKEVQSELSIPILNALEESYKYIKKTYPQIKKVGLLATTGTIETRLYEKYFYDMEMIYPNEITQRERVMKAIYEENGIKAGNTGKEIVDLLKSAANELIEKGAQLMIAGCTEVPLALKESHISKPLLDPMDIAAKIVTQNKNQE